ncbi:hypothetical protein C488_08597 [Natrinema pellirubrum DSM 15624]|uniref:Uncharacterized protein n=1 Tax=Natrinema pellirubrum (strain DSM 15624 / CIP 106293 / JCM 10476 / NCIMB 786 / 157) TaxID=797303 RepID=L0JN51_NATP1|nr:hypothetical protein [Natrinema pellirubrum]AGB32694.1 hypothetical protein Natpe_2897 [Natrinema pellirubrum DSM 15624]ELY75905.1 hypothetical protein C488_08597 [Natrinema pellirubrum DSM 15624]
MTGTDARESTTPISWTRGSQERPAPLVERVPYVELRLEHPSLEADRFGDAFFPDAIPYEFRGERRVFYWRSVLPPDGPAPADWTGVCATTHGLRALTADGTRSPSLWPQDGTIGDGAASGTDAVRELVVDGTVAGDSTVAAVRDYSPPAIAVRATDADAVSLETPAGPLSVPAGERTTVELSSQSVRSATDGESRTVTPRLRVRYPGQRTLYHPARGADTAVFPSFGLDLETLPNPVPVPTAAGELDDRGLAAALGVDLSERPYPERVLWQAIAYGAFDPHRGAEPRLSQPRDDLLRLENPTA